MPELIEPKTGVSLSRRILRVALLGLVLALLAFGGILFLFNRPFSSSPPTLTASRLTVGNRLFPVQVAVFPERVALHKPRFFGHMENSISIDQIASVKIQASVVFADVVLDTTGGSPPLVIHGLFKKDAETLREQITAARENRRKPPA
ncbi:MAG: PH domain-containing protein [Acidobacteriota bacterium]|nr:PH domain-containing protein [Acidobacteriota bacterium]